MNQKKLSIRFVISKAKLNQRGLCPISCRITFENKRKSFSTSLFVAPDCWSAKKQLVLDRDIENQNKNGQLSLISQKINQAYLFLQVQNTEFNVDDILDKYSNKKIKKEDNVVSYFKRYLLAQYKLINKDIKPVTWKKFEYVCNHVASFISFKYHKKDFPLNKLNQQFLNDFEYYLKTEKDQKQVTVNKVIQRFRKPIKLAVSEGYLNHDPFVNHKPNRAKKEVVFLSTEELILLEKHHFEQARLQLVRDLFIFCCYTGLAYHEMANLKKEHLVNGFDGNQWIQIKREKTSKLISVPILPKVKILINKYDSISDYVLPKFSNQKINSYLKEIAWIVGISKKITHHTARKTFASTVLLYNDVPMEIVSELLGHSNMNITQEYYGKVVQKSIGREMVRLSKKLGSS
ncbi:site-specific integrase [Cellulophaga baltica]|uniref:Integrase n=1 Tax=Cellulophaga baltica 18 TaxID=1348584 RepID=A0AAU8RE46_9FLAO|nr:site-specific integrase [Cellulophaga baltica]AIZ41215.1 integrase [Cellulophaga baltica 18]